MTEPLASGAYKAHGPGEPIALGEQSYAHLGYMSSIGPADLEHHLIHAHGVAPDAVPRGYRAVSWCRQVELHALHHEVRVRSCALRDIEPAEAGESRG